MTTSVRATFQPDAGATVAWDLARAQLDRPRSGQPSLDYVCDELALRDLMARYAYTWDQGDLDGLMAFFTNDCVITYPHGTVSGSAAIRANYEQMVRDTPRRHHLICNVVVRLSEGRSEGWLTAYFYALLEPQGAPARTVSGLIADTVVKRDGEWKIRARSICIDTMADVTAAG